MSRKYNSQAITLRRTFVIIVIIILALLFVILVLEKTKITNLYEKPNISTSNAESAVRSVNDVNYNPATTTETEEANRIKAAAQEQLNNNTAPTPTAAKIDVSFSAAAQDIKGGPIVVRAIVGTNAGQCKLTIANDSTVLKEYSAAVENTGTYYSCKGFDVPTTDIPIGVYLATLTVTNGSATGTITQQVEVSK